MKKMFLISALAVSVMLTAGCQAMGTWYNDNKEELYTKIADKAVIRLNDLIDENVDKLVADGKITNEYAVELKDKCKKAVKTAFYQIDELIKKNKK